ncbi:glycosyltransferase family 4 protein [Geomobilimonas luticola]|uniref:Glycosyltransferase family 4 protein n=1 Tax=Geomobilimonas luticola TaxID=1114878 RepID=A0ABS5SEK5_9BACT|nr:glycosyltransferase family 4 protein [Geomobilimonas luticola]MBT0653794.1 glycosyltransferase family 4 protein [Geomobilimonas luticola]
MKIVFLAPFGIRPKGTVIARMVPLAAALQESGHTVTIIAPPYTNPEDSGKTEVVRGVAVRNVALGPRNKALAAPVLAGRMFRTMLAEKPDLVHLFKPKGYGGLAAMLHLLLQRLGVRLPPLFVDMDDWEGGEGMNALHQYSRLERRVYDFQEAWLPPRAAGVTAASRTLEERVRSMGVERVLYLPNCVEAVAPGSGAVAREKLGIPPGAPVVLLYTRFFEFDQEKLHVLFAEICRRVPQVRFLVVGKGRNNEEALLLQAGERMGFAPALVVAGWVEPTDLPDYLAAGDVAIYPFADTLVNRAKCPAKLTELLRAGVPVVADRVGQLAEYISADASGILCDPDDWQEMADRVVELLLDPSRGRTLGETGRRYLLEQFSWRDFSLQLQEFYLQRKA